MKVLILNELTDFVLVHIVSTTTVLGAEEMAFFSSNFGGVSYRQFVFFSI